MPRINVVLPANLLDAVDAEAQQTVSQRRLAGLSMIRASLPKVGDMEPS